MQDNSTQQSPSVAQTLGLDARARRRRLWSRLLFAIAFVTVGGGVAVWLLRPKADVGPQYETADVVRGSLKVLVTATGTLNARDAVDVGAEITGRVLKVPVDFNDQVEVGQVLAEIDTEQYEGRLDESHAQLAAAKASLVTAEVTVREAELKAARLEAMTDAGLASTQELETAMATYDRAKASVVSAKAQLTSAQASLKVAQNNLSKAVIRSPIEGIVLDRKVEPGQTVTSGLQTPVLFTLAADLSELRLDVKVDEADVGQVKAGQSAQFTVDAYPNRVFSSTVLAVKNMPTTDQNVVTYEARLSVRNEDGLLRPGMTAMASILVSEEQDVLLVPNAALRYNPGPGRDAKPQGLDFSRLMRGRPPRTRGSAAPASKGAAPGASVGPDAALQLRGQASAAAVWVLDSGKPSRVPVQLGATDGVRTAVGSKQLKARSEVIVAEVQSPDE